MDHAGRGPCGPSALVNATHLSSSPGRKPLGLSTQYCRQPSHMGAGSCGAMAPSGGFSASTPPLRIPLPRLENNRGNQVETQIRHPVPPVPPGQTPPPPLHPLAQGGRASTAWFALARPRGHCGSFPEFPAARLFTQPALPRGTWGTRLEPLPSSPPIL